MRAKTFTATRANWDLIECDGWIKTEYFIKDRNLTIVRTYTDRSQVTVHTITSQELICITKFYKALRKFRSDRDLTAAEAWFFYTSTKQFGPFCIRHHENVIDILHKYEYAE